MAETITIQLTKGQSTVIDAVDADLAEFRWHAALRKDGTGYAVRSSPMINRKRIRISLHRVVLERKIGRSLEKGELPDHINGNGLDNRRENLRVASNAENTRNRRRLSNNTSGFKGVHLHKHDKRWCAVIYVNRKPIHLGSFQTPELAYEAYKKAAVKYYGEFARFE